MRVSNPVRASISFSSARPTPPRRAWPNASVSSWPDHASPPVHRDRPLRHHDDRERPPAIVAAAQVRADLVEVERPLGHEDRVGAAGQPGVHRDPAGMTAHDLADEHAVVRLGGRVEAVDRVGGDLHRRLEAEGVVGSREVVVDRLGDADHRDARRAQPARDAERVLATDRDQRVDAEPVERGLDALLAVGVGVGVRPRRAEDRPAARQDPLRRLVGELAAVAGKDAGPAVAEAVELEVVGIDPRRTTPRITAFNPGQSPPPVSTPTRMAVSLSPSVVRSRRAPDPSAAIRAPLAPRRGSRSCRNPWAAPCARRRRAPRRGPRSRRSAWRRA